ncbi:MAG: hypothetical protein ACUVRH_02170 [Candidatus Bipolaricaulia bacterium]
MGRQLLLGGLMALALLLLGCDELLNWWAVHAELDEPFTLGIGQTAQVEGLQVTFTKVLEDSRCPVDVVCVWAGNAKVELELALSDHGRSTIELNSTLEPREISFAGYLVRYIDLKPHRKSTQPIDPQAYRLTLVISRD